MGRATKGRIVRASIEDIHIVPQTWPKTKPDYEQEFVGWWQEAHEEMFDTTGFPPKQILEVGSFLGQSTQYMAERWPEAHITCVDNWSCKLSDSWAEKLAKYLEDPYNRFLANMWDYRDRITIVKENDPPATFLLAVDGFYPDLVYLDGSHEFNDVIYQLYICGAYWPTAVVMGDDYNFTDVQRAIKLFCKRHNRAYRHFQERAWRLDGTITD
jgi:hypothetical protein